jgi:hypothetical protein
VTERNQPQIVSRHLTAAEAADRQAYLRAHPGVDEKSLPVTVTVIPAGTERRWPTPQAVSPAGETVYPGVVQAWVSLGRPGN